MRTATTIEASGGASWREPVDFAVEAETLGLHVCWVAEAWGSDAPSALGYRAARTERMLLGSGIMQVGTRTPVAVAQTAITLSNLSDGRFVLGLGASGPQVMEGLHGVPFARPLARTRETVEIVRRVLEGGKISYAGKEFAIPLPGGEAVPMRLSTRAEHAIPIYLATLSPAMLRLTGEVADGWLGTSFVPEGAAEAYFSHLDDGLARSGRSRSDLDVCQGAEVAFAPDEDALRTMVAGRKKELAFSLGGMGSASSNFYNQAYSRQGWADVAAEVRERWQAGDRDGAAGLVTDEMVLGTTLIGTEPMVRERLRVWRDAGVDTVRLYPAGDEPTELGYQCLAVTAAAAARVTGADATDYDLGVGVSLLDGLAVDDEHLDDPALVLALPAVFRAVYDETVHLISPTQHDAAGRAAWLRPVAELLGLRVDLLDPDDDYEHRAARYDADIICGAHAQFAFDVLRNSLARDADDLVSATTEAAVIDRVDTVLIDEAYTPLNLTSPVQVDGGWHRWADDMARRLEHDHHFVIWLRTARLTPAGVTHVREHLDLADAYRDHVPVFRLVEAALAVRECYRRGRHYELSDGAVTGNQFPTRVREAIAVHEGLPVTTAPATVAMTSGRAHILRYDFVTGIGVVTQAAARRLKKAYGLRAHARRGSDTAGDDVFGEEFSRVIDDIRSAHDETLTEWCDELTDSEDPVGGLRALIDEHIGELLRACRDRELTYPELLRTLAAVYPCTFPPHPPMNLADVLRAGVERALAERLEQVEDIFGEGAMDELIRQVVLSVRTKHWGWHLTDLDTVCLRSWCDPPRRRTREFRRRADERFAELWRDLREEIIQLIYNVELEPVPPE